MVIELMGKAKLDGFKGYEYSRGLNKIYDLKILSTYISDFHARLVIEFEYKDEWKIVYKKSDRIEIITISFRHQRVIKIW